MCSGQNPACAVPAALSACAIVLIIPIDIDGIAQQPEFSILSPYLGSQPVSFAVAHPLSRRRLVAGRNLRSGCETQALAVIDPFQLAALRSHDVCFQLNSTALLNVEEVARMRGLISGSC